MPEISEMSMATPTLSDETIAARREAREDREARAALERTPAAALTAVGMMMPAIEKLKSDTKDQLATIEESIRADIEDHGEKLELQKDAIECLTHNVNCLAALLSVFIQELDPAAFKRGKEGVEKARRFAKEWQEDPGFE